MKKRFLSAFLGVAITLMFVSCISNEINSLDTNQEIGVTFSIGILEAMSKAGTECPTIEDLKGYADDGRLYAESTISSTIDDEKTTEIYNHDIRLVNEKYFHTDPLPIGIGTNTLDNLKIFLRGINGSEDKLLYSAVTDSETTDEYLLELLEGKPLVPIDITLSEGQLAAKTKVKVYVVCTENRTAQDFGFDIWDIDSFNIHQIPIKVFDCCCCDCNCDCQSYSYKYDTRVATGYLYIYKASGAGNGTSFFDPKVDIPIKKIPFGENTTNYDEFSRIWFLDDLSIDNNEEYYGFVFVIYEDLGWGRKSARAYAGSRSVEDLLAYKDSNIWNEDHYTLDFYLCLDNKRWFLDYDTSLFGYRDYDKNLD